MNILFLGYVVDPAEAEKYNGISVAGNKMQWNIISNLSKLNSNITCISLAPHASFPKEKILMQHFRKILYSSSFSYINPSYFNVPFIKQLSQIMGVFIQAYKHLKNNPDSIVILYNLSIHIGIPFNVIRKIFPKHDYVCIVADLPLIDDYSRRGFYSFFTRLGAENWCNNLKKCDKFIALNENAVKPYIDNKPYIIIDGGVDEKDINIYDEFDLEKTDCDENKHVVFAGSLVQYNGILELIDAMNYVNDKSIVLDIYGNGVLEDLVKNRVENKNNIVFHGRVTNLKVLSAQRNAWLVIATRHVNDPITKVTFPSKTFEILLSETPFLSTRLDCYMNEYKEYINFIDDNTPVSIAKAINDISVSDYSELKQKAHKAKKFVLKNKLWGAQSLKIKRFLENVEK